MAIHYIRTVCNYTHLLMLICAEQYWCDQHCCTHHVAQTHSGVVGIVLDQGVVMCGEESATADLLSKLFHNSAGDRCAIICGCAPSYKQFLNK